MSRSPELNIFLRNRRDIEIPNVLARLAAAEIEIRQRMSKDAKALNAIRRVKKMYEEELAGFKKIRIKREADRG